MDFLEPFVAVLVILWESLKLLPKNMKLMAFTLIIPTLLSSLSFLISYLLCVPMSRHFFTILPSIEEDFMFLPSLEQEFTLMLAIVLFILVYSITVVYSTITTILVAANSYIGRTLSYKDLALLTIQTLKRQHTTKKYMSHSLLIYIAFVIFVVSPILTFSDSYIVQVFFIPILACITTYIWYQNLSVAQVLGSIISVIEENWSGIEALGKARKLLKVEENWSGVEALGKARKLLKGQRIQGFLLNLMFNVLVVVLLFGGFTIIRGHKWQVCLITRLLLVIFTCLLRFFYWVAFTVLYFQCKKKHGEEIELQGIIKHSEISTRQPVDDTMSIRSL